MLSKFGDKLTEGRESGEADLEIQASRRMKEGYGSHLADGSQ